MEFCIPRNGVYFTSWFDISPPACFIARFFICWIIIFSWRAALICLVVLVLGWTNIHRFLAFHFNNSFSAEKPVNSFRGTDLETCGDGTSLSVARQDLRVIV